MNDIQALHKSCSELQQQNAMIKACQEGKLLLVQTLFLAKIPLNIVTEKTKFSLMHYAANGGHVEVVRYLLKNGAPFDSADANQRTPLHWACQNGHKQVIDVLVSKGANINSLDILRCTPLHMACIRTDTKSPELRARLAFRLVAAGANPSMENNKNEKPSAYLDEVDLTLFQKPEVPFFLPTEVWAKISEYVTHKDLFHIMQTCKALYNASLLSLKNRLYRP
jgi:hypothetical protein